MIWLLPGRSSAVTIVSLVFPVYYIVLSLVLQFRRTA